MGSPATSYLILQIRSGQFFDYTFTGVFGRRDDVIYHAVTFTSQHTYLGLPQLKAYRDINVFFQFRPHESNGLIMFNAGKDQDFFAVEMVRHLPGVL